MLLLFCYYYLLLCQNNLCTTNVIFVIFTHFTLHYVNAIYITLTPQSFGTSNVISMITSTLYIISVQFL